MMRANPTYWRIAILLCLLAMLGVARYSCSVATSETGSVSQKSYASAFSNPLPPREDPKATSNEEAVRDAEYSMLFVGNSHTQMHNMPGLVARMIEFRHPGKKVATQCVPCGFLEDAANNPYCIAEIKSRPWKHVILQAQKISVSGKHEYSRKEGIELARLAQEHNAKAIYYGEWGLKGVAGDGARQTKVYLEMAEECGASVAPVAKAWDLALAKDPSLKLHSADGNHQSEIGAFLTACVLYGQIMGESALELASFEYAHVDAKTRQVLAECADAAHRSGS